MREQVSALALGLTRTLKQSGVVLIQGKAILNGSNSVRVNETSLEADAIILATGSKAADIPPARVDSQRNSPTDWGIGNSNDFLSLEELPQSVLIVGAGAIGCEFADLLNRYGVKVTLIEMLPQVLPQFDSQIAQALARSLKKLGIEIRTGTQLNNVIRESNHQVATFQDGSQLSAERILVAVGRRPNIDNSLFAGVDVEIKEGAIAVNEDFRTAVPSIFAVGDVIGGAYLLAHAAEAQGEHAALAALGKPTPTKGRSAMLIPGCVYTDPEVSILGITRAQAQADGIDCVEGKAYFLANGRAVASEQTEGVAKIVADTKTGTILGAHICGAFATELIAALTVAIHLHATVADLAGTIWAHPTCSEVLKDSARSCLEQLNRK